MKEQNIYSGFKVERIETVQEISGTAYLLRHEKSGARLLYIDADDTNKVFSISFRTPPKDAPGWPILWSIPYFAGHVNSL